MSPPEKLSAHLVLNSIVVLGGYELPLMERPWKDVKYLYLVRTMQGNINKSG
jgi:hypothetical protein